MNRISLPYQSDCTTLFAAVRGRRYPVLLDSGHPGSPWGRYDIICADPLEVIHHRAGRTEIESSDGTRTYSGLNPFEAVRQKLQLHPQAAADNTIPFCGGALGYFGYDLGRTLERLPNIAQDTLHCADMQVGIYLWALVTDHKQQTTELVSHHLPLDALQQIVDNLPPRRTLEIAAFTLSTPFASNMDRSGYQQRFDRVQDYIHGGDCYQVNLAQRFSADYRGDPWQAYCLLRQHAPTPFSAYIEHGKGAILSLSPERFLAVDCGQVETRPIKGTRPRSPNKSDDAALKHSLSVSEKDRAENLMIVDLLRNDIGRTCIAGSVRVPELFKVESYANVHHLVSTVTGRLRDPGDPLPLLSSCFPGGSITGAPKIRAMEIIEELEPHRRGPYCGSIGYIGFDGRMDSNICIRTLLADAGTLHCWAGGGIVADSNADAEYQETFDKVNNLLHALEKHFRSTLSE